MATSTNSLEHSLQKFSLNKSTTGDKGGFNSSATSEAPENQINTLELNPRLSLPYQWEQVLDLKTGEIYYMNRVNGIKVKEDPRVYRGEYYTDEDDSSYESDESLISDSSPSSSSSSSSSSTVNKDDDHVLVVAGCKNCLMYRMLPKHVQECPKCNSLLLHFDQSQDKPP